MAFSISSTGISLNGTFLHANCRDLAGRYQASNIDINNCIANDDGVLHWRAGGNFKASSRNLKLEGTVLKCESKNRRGQWRRAQLHLDEKIENSNGKLIFSSGAMKYTGSFSKSSTGISLTGAAILRANCRDRAGAYHESQIDVNNYIVNDDGVLRWRANGNFKASSKHLKLEGSVLKCESKDRDGDWRDAQIDLDEKIQNFNGKLIYSFSRAIIKVDGTNAKETAEFLGDFYKAHKGEASTQVADEGTYKVLYIQASADEDEGLLLQVSAGVEASIFHVVGEHGGMQTVGVDVLQTKAQVWASHLGMGVGVSANLIDAHASVFDLTLGVGLDTGSGIKDDSFTLEFLGTGITFGRKVGISIAGTEFGVDFGRCTVM